MKIITRNLLRTDENRIISDIVVILSVAVMSAFLLW